MVEPESKDVNINIYQVFLNIMVTNLYCSLYLVDDKVMVEDLKVFR